MEETKQNCPMCKIRAISIGLNGRQDIARQIINSYCEGGVCKERVSKAIKEGINEPGTDIIHNAEAAQDIKG